MLSQWLPVHSLMARHKAPSVHCTVCAVQAATVCTTQAVQCSDEALYQVTKLLQIGLYVDTQYKLPAVASQQPDCAGLLQTTSMLQLLSPPRCV